MKAKSYPLPQKIKHPKLFAGIASLWILATLATFVYLYISQADLPPALAALFCLATALMALYFSYLAFRYKLVIYRRGFLYKPQHMWVAYFFGFGALAIGILFMILALTQIRPTPIT